MTPEYLLDAVGLLDDDLIQEAERRPVQRRGTGYRAWMGLAACLAIVVVLGYGLTHIRMGSKNSASPSGGAPAASSPPSSEPSCGSTANGSYGGDLQVPESPAGSMSGGNSLPNTVEPDRPGSGDWLPAIRVDGVIYYWDTKEYIHLEPEEDDIRYTTSFINSWEPEEDGQANFLPIGLPYVVLDNGTVAVLHNEETNTWAVYDSVPPWEK